MSEAWFWGGYLVVAAFFCIATWIENGRVYYVMGDPPSGIVHGLTWPIWVPIMIVMLTLHWNGERKFRPAQPTREAGGPTGVGDKGPGTNPDGAGERS